MKHVVYLDQSYVAADQARLPVLSRAVLYGEGLFETLRTYAGRPFALREHCERLERSAQALQIPLPSQFSRAHIIIARLLAQNELRDAVVRISVLAGRAAGGFTARTGRSHLLVSLRRIPLGLDRERKRGIAAVTSAAGTPFLAAYKSTSYLRSVAAVRASSGGEVREVLFVDDAGRILEGAASNVFAIIGETLVTPPAQGRILPGITRRIVMEIAAAAGCPVRERPLEAKILREAAGLFITNSVIELMPVIRVDGRRVGHATPHPLTRTLHALYREWVRRELGQS
jgi:branched-subunit amino acid aminotransferase/4-amino-4-deoxychorismate lyase